MRGPGRWLPAALLTGACLLATGCSGGSGAASGTGAAAAGRMTGSVPGPTAPRHTATLTSLPPPGGRLIIYNAHLAVRVKSPRAAAAAAASTAASAGGYVASENATTVATGRPESVVTIEVKVPAAAYPAVLATLSRLGTRVSLSERAQDVTQTVADVTSRVASARAAIAQLRRLLARAGSVRDLLAVQNQISEQEAALESLQAQQAALAHETSFATISLLLTATRPPTAPHRGHPGGFTGGLAAGWHALRVTVTWLLTAVGAALPVAAAVGAVALAAYLAWRRSGRRKVSAGRAPTPGAPGP